MRRTVRWAMLSVMGLWGCSSSNSTTTPPPTSTVASVDVTPGTAAMNPAATLQLTATPRDAQGAAVSGVTVTWSSSAATVASVSSSGMVTSVAVGSATITASAGGKQGQAVITVLSGTYGPVVAQTTIGPSGGTVGTTDIGVTVPSGALSSTTTIKLIQDTTSGISYTGNGASSLYFIDGLPAGVTVSMRVRIKTTGTNAGTSAIALLLPTLVEGNAPTYTMGPRMFPATDSSGYLVATIPVTGRISSTWAAGSPGAARGGGGGGGGGPVDASLLNADGGLLALFNLSHATSTGSHFDLWGLGGTDATMQSKLTKTGQLAEQAYTTLQGMGYDFSFRPWPVQIYVDTVMSGAFGYFALPLPYPVNPTVSYIKYRKTYTDDPEYPAVVIHELFHLVKSNLFGKSQAQWEAKSWLDEATSTWVQEKHPAIVQPYANTVIALSWKDSLFSGINNGMVANSGYGKAPMIKYIAKQWTDAKVKNILDLIHGGMAPTDAFLAGIPEAPKLWWPELLTQHLGGSLYPWTTPNLVPRHTYNLTPDLGAPVWRTDQLYALGVEGEMLTRDTAMFGPNFVMPVYLDSAAIAWGGTILAFQKSAASANFRPLDAGDTVHIPGYLLQRKDSILLIVTPVKPAAPYTAWWKMGFVTDLRLPEGDWYFPTITSLANGVHFTCDHAGQTVTMAMDTNAVQIWSLLSSTGTWKKTSAAGTVSETHTWAPTPANADSLSKYHMTLTSTMVTGETGDTIHAQAHLVWSLAGGPGGSGQTAPAGASWWWFVLPLGALPLAFRRRTRTLGIAVTGLSLLVLASCVAGQISLNVDETLNYTFTKMRFTADPNLHAAPLMQVYQGSGTTTLNSYRSEYWSYTTNNSGGTDSTRVVCTGSGAATYKVDGAAYADSVTPPASVIAPAAAVRHLLGRDMPPLEKYLKPWQP